MSNSASIQKSWGTNSIVNWGRLVKPKEREIPCPNDIETDQLYDWFLTSAPSLSHAPKKVCGIVLPQELTYLSKVIEKSRWMLDLRDNWDDEGSPAYTEKTWKRAMTFLLKNAVALWQEKQLLINAPAVHNGPEGSIDIYWETPSKKLLINVPSDDSEPVKFYGYDTRGNEVKGTLNLSETNQWLILWQME
jgi:hypothetical protein